MKSNIICNQYHPMVTMLYILSMVIITMSNINPILISVSFFASFFYLIYIDGIAHIKRIFIFLLPVLFFSVIIMPLFHHNGVTPLFYVNDMPVTLETVIYGLMMTFLLLAVMQWFMIWNKWISSDKFLYIFSKISPAVSLILSMVFRMLPLMKKRWQDIHDAQKGMGCIAGNSILERAKQCIKEISILLSWCLENSIDTSISMEGRGYGIGKRTSFHVFRYHVTDIVILTAVIIEFVFIIINLMKGSFEVNYFPEIYIKDFSLNEIIIMVIFIGYSIFPTILELFGGKYFNA